MRLRTALFAAPFALGACASAQLPLSYPASLPDADVMVGEQRYQVWFHDTDSTVLIQRGAPRPLGQLLAGNLTLYALDRSPPEPVWRAAANAVLQQIHCEATELRGAAQLREAGYECIPGVDITEAIALNRAQWRRGVRVAAPAV